MNTALCIFTVYKVDNSSEICGKDSIRNWENRMIRYIPHMEICQKVLWFYDVNNELSLTEIDHRETVEKFTSTDFGSASKYEAMAALREVASSVKVFNRKMETIDETRRDL